MKSFNTIRMGLRTGGSVHLPLGLPGFQSIAHVRPLHVGTCGCKHQSDIEIPNKINRGPTDILRALASTIQRDTTAAHYKYHDDPYFIPTSNNEKRTFALTKESGRKAAQWVRSEHPDLFRHHNADPPIAAFLPRMVYNDESQVDEDELIGAIKNVAVSDAITIYQLLEKKDQTVSPATRQSLLELLCFYNAEDPLSEDFLEERWFWQGRKSQERLRKTWKDSGIAESVFRTFDSPNAAAYCALVRGMARFCQADRAWLLYQEMQEKQLPLDVETYNSLIRISSFLRESHDLRWKLVEELLTAMWQQNIAPTVDTLNSVLDAINCMYYNRQAKNNALRILSEFKLLGIKPTLSTYYYLLIIFCKEGGPRNLILAEILNHIDGEAFTISDSKDTFFFVTAMDICRNHLHDKDLAHRVNRLLHTANNYDLIGDSFKESIYYRHYLTLLCTTEPLDVLMEFYIKLVPNIYIPEPSVMEELIKAINMNGAIEHLPRIWSDMVLFNHTDRSRLVEVALKAMVRNQPPEGSPLVKQFADIGLEVWKIMEATNENRYRQFECTGRMVGNVMVLLLRGGELDRAFQALCKLEKEQHTVVGLPDIKCLQLFLDVCIIHNNPSRAIACIRYCAEAGFPEVGIMTQQLRAALPLDEDQIAQLVNIVGKEAMEKEDTQEMAIS